MSLDPLMDPSLLLGFFSRSLMIKSFAVFEIEGSEGNVIFPSIIFSYKE